MIRGWDSGFVLPASCASRAMDLAIPPEPVRAMTSICAETNAARQAHNCEGTARLYAERWVLAGISIRLES